MPLDYRPPKVITKRGQKKVQIRTSGNNSQVTVIACVSATGHAIPPFVEWTKGQVRAGISIPGAPGKLKSPALMRCMFPIS